MRQSVIAKLLFVLVAAPVCLTAQVTVSGTVVERTNGAPIPGATVRLAGVAEAATDAAGRFRFADVNEGPLILSVASIGHQYRTITFTVHGDTTIHVELDRATTQLDTVVVHAGTVTIKGNVRDKRTDRYLMNAQVTIFPGGQTVGANSGDFRFENQAKGQPITVVAVALEHLPNQVEFTPGRDTTIIMHLDIDSVGLRMIAQQVKRIAARSMSVPTQLVVLDRDRIMEHVKSTFDDILKQRLPRGAVPSCVYLDDVRVDYGLLANLAPEAIERVEIYGFRGKMICVYSKRYVASLIAQPELPLIPC